jgi:uncharacterized membrane protein
VTAGLVGTVFGRLALFTGIQRVGASRAEPLKASTPFFASIVAVLVLGGRMSPEHFLGVVLIVAVLAVISLEQASGPTTGELGSVSDLGFPLLAALLFAVEPTFAKIGFGEGTPFVVGLLLKTSAATVGFLGYLRLKRALPRFVQLPDRGDRWAVAAGLANTAFVGALYPSLSVAPSSSSSPSSRRAPRSSSRSRTCSSGTSSASPRNSPPASPAASS